MGRQEALRNLSFGRVDAESIQDLDQRFLRTSAFDHLVSHDVAVVRGPKGTGKSALFELLTRFGSQAKQSAQGRLDDVLLVAGSGFLDLQEVVTDDIEALKSEDGYDHDRLWRLYIGLKVALALEPHASLSAGPVRELLKATGAMKDHRLLPLLRMAWRRLISSNTPENLSVGILKFVIKIVKPRHRIDVTDLLNDAQNILQQVDKSAWILFDKIDELYARDRLERRRAIEGLMSAMMSLRRGFPRIRITVFIRSDIWSELSFTNKSHLLDKTLDLKWTHSEIALLLVKAAAAHPEVEKYIKASVRGFDASKTETLTKNIIEKSLAVVLPKELQFRDPHPTLNWFVHRIRDANGIYPREAILWGNKAADMERGIPATAAVGTSLVSSTSLINTYASVSTARCESYLAEFPDLREHFARFEGQEGPQFKKTVLNRLMRGLKPSSVEMLRTLEEVGVIVPVEGNVAVATLFEVPLLYRRGLGLTTPDWI